jgi:hypothetical protein
MDKALKKRQKSLSETWPSAETTVTMAPATGPGRRTVCSMVVPPEHGPPERCQSHGFDVGTYGCGNQGMEAYPWILFIVLI